MLADTVTRRMSESMYVWYVCAWRALHCTSSWLRRRAMLPNTKERELFSHACLTYSWTHARTSAHAQIHTFSTHTSWRGRPFSEARKASRCLKRSSACASSPTTTASPSMSASTSTKSWCDCSCNRTHARSDDVPCTHISYTLCYVRTPALPTYAQQPQARDCITGPVKLCVRIRMQTPYSYAYSCCIDTWQNMCIAAAGGTLLGVARADAHSSFLGPWSSPFVKKLRRPETSLVRPEDSGSITSIVLEMLDSDAVFRFWISWKSKGRGREMTRWRARVRGKSNSRVLPFEKWVHECGTCVPCVWRNTSTGVQVHPRSLHFKSMRTGVQVILLVWAAKSVGSVEPLPDPLHALTLSNPQSEVRIFVLRVACGSQRARKRISQLHVLSSGWKLLILSAARTQSKSICIHHITSAEP